MAGGGGFVPRQGQFVLDAARGHSGRSHGRDAALKPIPHATRRRGRLRLQVEETLPAKAPRCQHRQRPAIEGGHAADSEPLGRDDEERVGEPQPMLRRRLQQNGGLHEVRVCGSYHPYGSRRD